MEIFTCEQGSADWFAARSGIPTASEFHTVMASGKGGGESKTRRTYLMKLAGEIITGEPAESYTNGNMERGHEMEPEARSTYAFMTDVEPQIVGFIRSGDTGCSPDALIGTNGMLEVKTNAPHILIDRLLRDEFPPEYKAQCQGALWIAEREWIDLACYWPKLPIFIKRAHRDEAYIRELSEAVDYFNAELENIVERVRRFGGMAVAA